MATKVEKTVEPAAQLPKTIFVKKEIEDADSSYLLANEQFEGNFEAGDYVGVYELKRVTKMAVVSSLVPVKTR